MELRNRDGDKFPDVEMVNDVYLMMVDVIPPRVALAARASSVAKPTHEKRIERLFFFFFFFFFFGWGKGGKCVMHRVWDSSAACRWANEPVGQELPPDLPTKTHYLYIWSGCDSHIWY